MLYSTQEETMTSNRRMLILDQGLVGKIDENRGDLTRAEFIEFCVDNCLGQIIGEEAISREERRAEIELTSAREAMRREERHAEAVRREERRTEVELTSVREKEAIYVTGEELEEFKHGIRDLIRAFLEFTITFGLELGPGRTAQDLETIRMQLHTVLGDK